MARLTALIRDAIDKGDYVLSKHATERLRERRITEWQVAVGAASARVLCERPADRSNPSVEMEQTLPDGTRIKAVWSWLPESRMARLITVHFFDQ